MKKKVAYMVLAKRVRDGGSLMQKIWVKRTLEMQPEWSRECRGVTSLRMESGHSNVATRVVPRESIALVSFIRGGGFFIWRGRKK